VTGCSHRFLQRIAASLALLATFALILNGALHIAGHVASGSKAHAAAVHHRHTPTTAAADGGDAQTPKHRHTAHHHHPASAPEPFPDADGSLCCCASISCVAALLPAGSTAVRYTVPYGVLTGLQRNEEAQFRPAGPRKPPRPSLIA
jgi:hypothetical protein